MNARSFTQSWLYKWVLVVLLISILAPYVLPQQARAQALPLGGVVFDSASGALASMLAPMGPFAAPVQLGPDGQPQGVLLSIEGVRALRGENPTEPAALGNPLSVSRIQSRYVGSSGLLTLTFSVRNNRPPLLIPPSPISGTITDTLSATLAIDPYQDPNAVHDVLLADHLSGYGALVDTWPAADRYLPDLAWNLGTIPPLRSVTATLVLQVPGGLTDFVLLDAGATAWGTLQGQPVSASAAPASLAPEDLAQWLIWTVDADYYDEYMVQQAGALANDWSQIFAYVRSLGYESYTGSLRGTRGTLWSEAGNSVDQASLLIAMLRGSGIPARYRHGTLSDARAQQLILSMFPDPGQVIGHIPAGTEVADPSNDPQLLAETRDHWWVEAYLPSYGDWVDLDPCFAQAQPGDAFYDSLAGDGTDQIAELPDASRHKITVSLKVEHYEPIGSIHGGMPITYPLSLTLNTVELVGNPLTLGHLVDTDGMGGAIFFWVQHTYKPYFSFKGQVIEGNPYDDLLSNFPFGAFLVTGVWLVVDVQEPGGKIEQYQRAIVDQIGFEQRRNGGLVAVENVSGLDPVLGEVDLYTMLFAPGEVPQEPIAAREQQVRALLDRVVDLQPALDTLGTDASDPDTALVLRESRNLVRDVIREGTGLVGLGHYASSDYATEGFGDTFLVKSYQDSPRIVIVNSKWVSDTVEFHIDLQKDDVRALPYPGQDPAMQMTFGQMRGIQETMVEGMVLSRFTGQSALTVHTVYSQARAQGLDMAFIRPDSLDRLAELDISEEARARIHEAVVDRDRLVLVPEGMVLVDGEPAIGWWEINPETGDVSGVMENGLHSGMVGYGGLLFDTTRDDEHFFALAGFLDGILAGGVMFMIHIIDAVMEGEIGNDVDLKALARRIIVEEAIPQLLDILVEVAGETSPAAKILMWVLTCFEAGELLINELIEAVFDIIMGELFHAWNCYSNYMIGFGGGAAIGLLLAAASFRADPPLPRYLLSGPQAPPEAPEAQSVIWADASYPSGVVSAELETELIVLAAPQQTTRWSAQAWQALAATDVAAVDAALYDTDGALLGRGTVHAAPLEQQVSVLAQGQTLQIDLQGAGRLSFHAPALAGLGLGGDWTDYSAGLSAAQPYTLTLQGALVTLNGADIYSGSFRLLVSGTSTLAGSGPTAVPNFGGGSIWQVQAGQLQTGPASGSLSIGGTAMDASAGLALSAYSGPITVSEATTATDQLALFGEADCFTLEVSPTASSADPNSSIYFRAQARANFSDQYTLTVQAPSGWQVDVDSAGWITATPPLGTRPADYTLLLTARSHRYPGLFAAGRHIVTTLPYQGMDLDLNKDPLVTVPWGPSFIPALDGETNNGQVQVPGAAFRVGLTNTSTFSHSFSLAAAGLPEGWLLLSGASGRLTATRTLDGGQWSQWGVYVSPDLPLMPPEGTVYTFTVDALASDYPVLQASRTGTVTVPAISFSHIVATPAILYSAPGFSATFDLALYNVGNTTDTLSLQASLPISTWTAPLISPVPLEPGQQFEQQVVLQTPSGEFGETYLAQVMAPSDLYTQTATVSVRIVSPELLALYRSDQLIRTLCRYDLGLRAATEYLVLSVEDIELACHDSTTLAEPGEADCATDLRDRVVSAMRAVAQHTEAFSPLLNADGLWQTAQEIATLTDWPLVQDRLALMSEQMGLLGKQLQDVANHASQGWFEPGLRVGLDSRATSLDLYLLNQGCLTTTFAVTLSGSTSFSAIEPADFVRSLGPGELFTLPIWVTPTVLGVYNLQAEMEPVEAIYLSSLQAVAGVKVVDALLRVTKVQPWPAFIEYGSDTKPDLWVELANVANIPLYGDALVEIWNEGGVLVYSTTRPVEIASVLAPVAYDLGTIDTTAFATGTYTVSVSVLDEGGLVIPKATGSGMLAVGQAVVADRSVVPEIVGPGTFTVTTYISTSLNESLLPMRQGGADEGMLGPSVPGGGGLYSLWPLAHSAVTLEISLAPTQTTAGASFDLTVRALDGLGGVAADYTGTVSFASSDAQASLPADYTFSGPGGDNGEHTFTGLVLRSAGLQGLSVTDQENGSLSDNVSIQVLPGALDLGLCRLSATGPHRADGLETSTIWVTATDSLGNGISGLQVWVAASGQENVLSGVPGTSNANGVFSASLSSARPEAKELRVLLGDVQEMNWQWLPTVSLVLFTGSSITGTVCSDQDRDGSCQPAEPGLGAVPVLLYDAAGTLLKTTVSEGDGDYAFNELTAGTYRLAQPRLDEYALSGASILTVTVGDFVVSTDHDLGNYAAGQAAGTVWHDSDQDGSRQDGEAGIPGVTVSAYDADSLLVDSGQTSLSGTYGLELAAGLPVAPDNFVFNEGYSIQEPATAVVGNGDFDRGLQALDPASYPANYDFESGDLGGWLPSDPAHVYVSDTQGLSGYYLQLAWHNQWADSTAFAVPVQVQSLRLDYLAWTERSAVEDVPLRVYVLSGPSFGTETEIKQLWSSDNDGWQAGVVDLQAYAGQTIKLRLRSDWDSGRNGRVRLDNVTLRVEVPDWQPSDAFYVHVFSDTCSLDGGYLLLDAVNQWADSTVLVVPADVQSLRLDYYAWTERSGVEQVPLRVYVLSGPTFETEAEIDRLWGSSNDGWRVGVVD
ncbi:MAG: Ig-like domain-containing protein, partial [Chloroflexia bacterium]|nr:Ig-like domain-containing protein [Chloroflexia bacterium]